MPAMFVALRVNKFEADADFLVDAVFYFSHFPLDKYWLNTPTAREVWFLFHFRLGFTWSGVYFVEVS